MREVYIIGVSQAPITRDPTVQGRDLATAVVRDALADAGIEKERVDALYVGNMTSGLLTGQQQLGALIADYAQLAGGIDAVTIEAACASGAAAARMGYLTIAGGMNDVVVVCGVEQMTHVDRDTATRALATAADWELENVRGESFMSLNAQLMRHYMERHGATARDFAPFSINAHRNALANPNALFHKPVDVDGYLASRVVIDPIRVFDASPICNGAAAFVLASADVAKALGDRARVKIAGSAAATAPLALQRRPDVLRLDAIEISTRKALEQAGARHRNVSFFELHDAFTIMAVLSLESAGFADAGTGTRLGTEGRIGIDGDLPLTTMGGLKARGHPVGATGVYQLVEAYLQLIGAAGDNQVPKAELGLVQNIGGTGATVVTHALRRVG